MMQTKSIVSDEKISTYRVDACESIEELNAAIGLAISFSNIEEITKSLLKVQNDLVGLTSSIRERAASSRITISCIRKTENEIWEMTKGMPKLHNFIIPGGSRLSSLLQFARTVCRRAERRIVTLYKKEGIDPSILTYMKNLSGLLFTHARFANHKKKTEEKLYKFG